jgi:hypothetical protein
MAVEGVFRKNGNIRVLQETVDSIDIKPNGQQIAEETNSIQLAALFKRFLRNLPDPLLTQKLYGLFIYSQSMYIHRSAAMWTSYNLLFTSQV